MLLTSFKVGLGIMLTGLCLVSAVPMDGANQHINWLAHGQTDSPPQILPVGGGDTPEFLQGTPPSTPPASSWNNPSDLQWEVQHQLPPSIGHGLDDETQEFLNSLLDDLSRKKEDEQHTNVNAPTVSSILTTGIDPPNAFHFWWEPKSFRSLQALPRKMQGHKPVDLVFNLGSDVRREINAQVFGGRLKWAPDADLARINRPTYLASSPYKRRSRKLPFVYFLDQHGSRLPIYITTHRGVALPGSVLHIRDFWLFWSLSELPSGPIRIFSLGAGYADTADHSDIDQHVRALLRAEEHLSSSHI